jgi:predicted permease
VARRKEIAMRLAIGATRKRVVQQLLTEGFVLSIIGTFIGFAIAALIARFVERVQLPLPFPVVFEIAFDQRLGILAGAMVIVSTILCALVPALQATRASVLPSLKLEVQSYGHRRLSLRGLLVVGQVAVSVLLLVITLLFLRNLSLARIAEPGFDADRVLLSQLTFVEGKQGRSARFAVEGMAESLRALPDVEALSFAAGVPLTLRNGGTTGTRMRIDGLEAPVRVEYDANRVGPDYFRTMGIRLMRGREFDVTDRFGAPRVAIVNEEFVRRYFDGQEPIGRGIYFDAEPEDIRAEVVGVVANSKYTTIGEERDAAVYTPYLQRRAPGRFVHLLARTAGAPTASLATIRSAIGKLDPDAANAIEPLDAAVGFAFLPSRIGAVLVGALGVLGAVLAMVGLYGVISFAVTRRASEIGIRLALGSSRRGIAAVVFKDGAWLVGFGMAAGLGLAWIITKPLSAFLVAGLATSDAISFIGTVVILSATSLLAGWGPTRRAIRVEPAVTLRAE